MIASVTSVLVSITFDSALGQSNVLRAPSVNVRQLDKYFDVETDPDDFFGDMSTRKRAITLRMITGKTKPELLAVFVGRGKESKDPGNSPAEWIPYADKVEVDLGAGDGERQIFVAAKWKATDKGYEGSGFGLTVNRSRAKPLIVITNPVERVVSQPVIQLQGYSPKRLDRISYELFDQSGKKVIADGDGFVTDQYFDKASFEFTTNYFKCTDVELQPGTNRIVLRCVDEADNAATRNLIYVFSTAGDHEPPVFAAVHWPNPGAKISGDSFTVRGRIDDYTARMTGQIVANGRTNLINGFPERNGCFWYEEVPLSAGANYVSLIATDAAGNPAKTNFVVHGSDGPIITLDPITPAAKLWEPRITVTGKVRPPNNNVWINGVQAVVKSDGTWRAESVPVRSPNGGGVATFDMTATPMGELTSQTEPPAALVAVHSSLGTNAIVLNASSPACGVFKLHLEGTAGRSFVLQASTNLADWMPLFTNSSPNASFDYTDSHADKYPCRFFRVVPLP